MRSKWCFYFILSVLSVLAGISLDISCPAQNTKTESTRIKPPDETSVRSTNEISETDDIIRVQTNLVLNEILVLDKQGEPIRDLSLNDFLIKEDDQIQEISLFSFGANESIPRSIVLIIDYSGSQLPYIHTSIEAAKFLVDKLNPQDRMAIVTDDIKFIQDFTVDRKLLKEKLESLKTRALSGNFGQSKQYSALMEVLNGMFSDTDYRPIIIFQTDGDELLKLKNVPFNNFTVREGVTNFRFEDVLTATEKTGVTIYTIIPGIRFFGIPKDELFERSKLEAIKAETAFASLLQKTFNPDDLRLSSSYLRMIAVNRYRQQSALNKIARVTGGLSCFLEQPEQAEKIYTEILGQMNVRYLIGYYPTNQTRDGKRRNITIKLPRHQQYEVRGRKTYFVNNK